MSTHRAPIIITVIEVTQTQQFRTSKPSCTYIHALSEPIVDTAPHKGVPTQCLNTSFAVILHAPQELIQRAALKLALSGRDQKGLEPILSFAVKQIDVPQVWALPCDSLVCFRWNVPWRRPVIKTQMLITLFVARWAHD